MDGGKCETCRFWKYVGKERGKTYARGQCRRHAPKPTDEETGKNLEDYCGTWWPGTDSDDWCGEFKPRAEGGGA